MKKSLKYVIALAILAIVGVAYAFTNLTFVSNINGDGFRLPNDSQWYRLSPQPSIGSWVCARNTGTVDVFIPANSSSEWTRVTTTNVPAGVTYDASQCTSGSQSCKVVHDCSEFTTQSGCNMYNPDSIGIFECTWNGSSCQNVSPFDCANYNSDPIGACNPTFRCDYY